MGCYWAVSPDSSQRRWRPVPGILLLTIVLLSCGYGPDSAHLPGGARSLSIGVIRNLTDAGELDVRLHRQLRRRFLRNPHIVLADSTRGNLLLDIKLISLTVTRGRDVSSTLVTSLSYRLAGEFSLRDARDGTLWRRNQPVDASATLNFDTATQENPAVQDEGLDDVLEAFAAKVERQVLTAF